MANYCDDILIDWLGTMVQRKNEVKLKTDATMSINLQSVFYFMEVCCKEFAVYDEALMEKIAIQASSYVFNKNYLGQCKQVSLQTLNLLTTKCRK